MKKLLKVILILCFMVINFSCQKQESILETKNENADILLTQVKYISSSFGRTFSSAAELTFRISEESHTVIVEKENISSTSEQGTIYDSNGNIAVKLEVNKLSNGQFKTKYFNKYDELFLVTEGDGEYMTITYSSTNEQGRIAGFWGCLDDLWQDRTFKIVTIAGYGAYVAAEAVIGCGIAQL